jgi:hypothetical protein
MIRSSLPVRSCFSAGGGSTPIFSTREEKLLNDKVIPARPKLLQRGLVFDSGILHTRRGKDVWGETQNIASVQQKKKGPTRRVCPGCKRKIMELTARGLFDMDY